MIVLGADMHKRSHSTAAIAATTGELKGDKIIRVGDDGLLALLDGPARWAQSGGGRWGPAGTSPGPWSDRERLIRSRVALNNDVLWHLHDLWPQLKLPGSALLFSKK